MQKNQLARRLLSSGLGILVSGLVYYLVFRDQLPWPFEFLPLEWTRIHALSDPSMGAYPSFAFTFSLGLIAMGLFWSNRVFSLAAIIGILTIGLGHEVLASTFAVADVLAGLLGTVLAVLVLYKAHDSSLTVVCASRKRLEQLKFIALMLVSASFATGTSAYDPVYNDRCIQFDENDTCIEREISASPVYMPYEVLRSSVKMSEPRDFESVSRIYLYQNYLFANERNAGIHVIDNTIPTSPVPIAFIEIPGNTELSIRDDNLYADSYIDLVTLDVSNINNISEIAREETIFPYNSRQNIPNNVRLVGDIESSRGVVVGYQR